MVSKQHCLLNEREYIIVVGCISLSRYTYNDSFHIIFALFANYSITLAVYNAGFIYGCMSSFGFDSQIEEPTMKQKFDKAICLNSALLVIM